MIFIANGYQGKKAPPPSMKGQVDLKNFAKIAMEATRQWTKDTMIERERDGIKVAKLFLEALPKN